MTVEFHLPWWWCRFLFFVVDSFHHARTLVLQTYIRMFSTVMPYKDSSWEWLSVGPGSSLCLANGFHFIPTHSFLTPDVYLVLDTWLLCIYIIDYKQIKKYKMKCVGWSEVILPFTFNHSVCLRRRHTLDSFLVVLQCFGFFEFRYSQYTVAMFSEYAAL